MEPDLKFETMSIMGRPPIDSTQESRGMENSYTGSPVFSATSLGLQKKASYAGTVPLMILGILIPVRLIAAKDYVSHQAEMAGELREAKDAFEAVTHSKATKENILASIDTALNQNSVYAALNVSAEDTLILKDVTSEKLKLVFDYYKYGGIKVSSASLLLKKDRLSGISRLKQVLSSREGSPMFRLEAAGALADAGDPSGYSFVAEQVAGKWNMKAKSATYFLSKFIRYDGMPPSKTGGVRINLEETLSKAGPEARKLLEAYRQSATETLGTNGNERTPIK